MTPWLMLGAMREAMMALDPEYLIYHQRRRGMDHDLYNYSNLFLRKPLSWPEGRRMAVPIVVSLEWFPIIPSDKPFRAPGHMQTAYPDYRHYTAREYGTRVGFYRFLDAFAKYGITASIAVNAAIARRYPSILNDIIAAGHEVVAHSTDMNGTIASGLEEAAERALIQESLDVLTQATGKRPEAWLSIARSQSFRTPALLAEAGIKTMLDWVNDELPYRMTTSSGPLMNLPLNHELSDQQIVTIQQHSAASYAEQIGDAYNWLLQEAEMTESARMMPLHLTPYVMGLPYRIGALEDLLGMLATQSSVWFTTVSEISKTASIQMNLN